MNKTFCFDLDGTLCKLNGLNYENSEPYQSRIQLVNELFDNGHTIIIETARGSETKIDWCKKTEEQLSNWGLKYHKLRVGVKISADYYIDDKGITDTDFFQNK